MADYTGLRCKVVIKEEFIPIITEMAEYGASWKEETANYPQHTFFQQYIENNRNANFIPHGVMMAVPSNWEDTAHEQGFHQNYNPTTKVWSFQCNFIDRGVLQDFFTLILPNVAEQALYLEVLQETNNKSALYELKDGQIVPSQTEGLLYPR